MVSVFQTLVAFSFCWLIASSLSIYPHSLSYFNESIGGPLNGPKHLLGSNVDWGQDLRYVIWWHGKMPKPIPLRLSYNCYFDPSAVCLECSVATDKRWNSQFETGSRIIHVHAVSVNFLQRWAWVARNYGTCTSARPIPEVSDENFAGWQPTARAGYSMPIYQVD